MLLIILSSVLPTKEDFYGFRILLAISVLTRALIVSVRYGYMTNSRYEALHQRGVDYTWITQDFILKGWLKQNLRLIKSEIEASKNRLCIEEHEFSLNFSKELPEKVAEKFSQVDYYEKRAISNRDIKHSLKHHKMVMKAKRRLEKKNKSQIGMLFFGLFQN